MSESSTGDSCGLCLTFDSVLVQVCHYSKLSLPYTREQKGLFSENANMNRIGGEAMFIYARVQMHSFAAVMGRNYCIFCIIFTDIFNPRLSPLNNRYQKYNKVCTHWWCNKSMQPSIFYHAYALKGKEWAWAYASWLWARGRRRSGLVARSSQCPQRQTNSHSLHTSGQFVVF